jgi:lipopolysaccharide transport system permease protein
LPLLALLVFFASGLGLLLALVNVFFRDVGQLLGLALQLWFWLTPVVYPVGILPEYARRLIELNPMLSVVQAYQSLFALGSQPSYASLAYPLALGVVLWLLALRMASKLLPDVVDEL